MTARAMLIFQETADMPFLSVLDANFNELNFADLSLSRVILLQCRLSRRASKSGLQGFRRRRLLQALGSAGYDVLRLLRHWTHSLMRYR